MSRDDGPADALATAVLVLCGLGVAGWLVLQGLALVPVYLPWVMYGLPVGLLAGLLALRVFPDRPRRPLAILLAAGAALVALALAAPAGMDWWADYDRALRVKPAPVLAAETARAERKYRRERREWRRDGEIGSAPERERPAPRWSWTEPERYNDVSAPLVRWVLAGFGLAVAVAALVAWFALRSAPPSQTLPQVGGLT
jgi:hypothetical protein